VSEIEIARGGADRIDDVEPLWHAMHRHHRSVAAHLTEVAPFRSDDESWVLRRAFYERLLARPDSFFLLAERDRVHDRAGPAGSVSAACSRAS